MRLLSVTLVSECKCGLTGLSLTLEFPVGVIEALDSLVNAIVHTGGIYITLGILLGGCFPVERYRHHIVTDAECKVLCHSGSHNAGVNRYCCGSTDVGTDLGQYLDSVLSLAGLYCHTLLFAGFTGYRHLIVTCYDCSDGC